MESPTTPGFQAPTDLRRRTILKNAIEASPLRKRSILPTTPVSAVMSEGVDDETERLRRRSSLEIQRRLSNLPQQESPLTESIKFIGEKEMKDHFQICTKLFAENKINNKNAWQLHIIELLRHLSQKKASSETLQVASTSLDISAKVYGIRVDDIHSEGLKLASTMARVSEKQTPQQLDEEGEENQEDGQIKKKKKKKRLVAGEKNTIAKDPKSLLGAIPKLESVFFSTRTNAETSAINNLLTNTLPIDHSGYRFLLLTNEKAWVDGPDPIVSESERHKKFPMKLKPLKDFKICELLNLFVLDNWDPDEEENQKDEMEKANTQRENTVVFDEHGVPIPELDSSIHDIFADDNVDDLDEEQDEAHELCAQLRGEVANIVDFNPEDAQKTEYSYSSSVHAQSGRVIDQVWAGPSHWKLKVIRRAPTKFSGQTVEKLAASTKKKRRTQAEHIDFDSSDEAGTVLVHKFPIKKKPPTVDPHKITLPKRDSSTDKFIETLEEFMTKPGCRPDTNSDKKEKKTPEDPKRSAYDYDNPSDSQYCAINDVDDNDIDNDNDNDPLPDDDDFFTEPAELAMPQQNFVGENLIDAPELVPKLFIPYAQQAKKMDMKKLKSAEWQILTGGNVESSGASKRMGKVIPTTFSELYKTLPEHLNERMKKELSCPLAFVALLHLCNEQNLELLQKSAFIDFDIQGPE